ncbi:MAG: hypothetical protein A2X86_16130 [Bdellovibrionales bacterium GWA2_49_15]|nr:MAG: hypothetical protein A2X86_16130 [Bdellovibrionales bacterium GWA2_49_15]HAZ13213.1 DUF434 domain-containing protein [Bdellovibrionales bacterium]
MARGISEQDQNNFASPILPILQKALLDLSWLLSESYSERAALQLVGDRYQLTRRQRMAVMRCSCSDADLERRQKHESAQLEKFLVLDGFNLLISLEVALVGGILLKGRDHCLRDLAGIHGSYRQVPQTRQALILLAEFLSEEKVENCLFYFDRRISNSGRIKKLVEQVSAQEGQSWSVELVDNCDKLLINSKQMVATSDGQIIGQVPKWYNLAYRLVKRKIPKAWIVDLANFQSFPERQLSYNLYG